MNRKNETLIGRLVGKPTLKENVKHRPNLENRVVEICVTKTLIKFYMFGGKPTKSNIIDVKKYSLTDDIEGVVKEYIAEYSTKYIYTMNLIGEVKCKGQVIKFGM